MKRFAIGTARDAHRPGGAGQCRRGERVRRRGAAAIMAILMLVGGLAVAFFALDSMRMGSDAARLKHATDAAAIAVSQAYAKDSDTDVQEMAERYVLANLGLDEEQLGQELELAVTPITEDGYDGFRISATFRADPGMMGGQGQKVTVSSAAVAIYNPLEVAVVIPNSGIEGPAEMAALRRLTNGFAEQLVGDLPDRWISLVPYSQTVNVYDDEAPNRIRRWAEPGALEPVELTSLFRSNEYGISNLASRNMPDLRTKRLDVYRGLHEGENYFWTEPPGGAFKVRYRADLPANAPSLPYIQWTGPNPMFGEATGTNDVRYIVADKGCPEAALLPLTNDLDAIDTRLGKMRAQFNVNYAIALGWGGMALSPAFRGPDGWGDFDHPLDFSDEGSTNVKAVVMFANTVGSWFDTDAYNDYVGEGMGNDQPPVSDDDPEEGDDGPDDPGEEVNDYREVGIRFKNLCQSFKDHGIKLYFIGVRPNNPKDITRTKFEQYAVPNLKICADKPDDIMFVGSETFAQGEGAIRSQLEKVASSLESESSYARLVE